MKASIKKHELKIVKDSDGYSALLTIRFCTEFSSLGEILDKVVFEFAKRYAEENNKNVIEMLDKADYLFKVAKSEDGDIALEVESYTIGLLHYFAIQGIGSTIGEVIDVISDDDLHNNGRVYAEEIKRLQRSQFDYINPWNQEKE